MCPAERAVFWRVCCGLLMCPAERSVLCQACSALPVLPQVATARALAKEDPDAVLLMPGVHDAMDAIALRWLNRYLAAGGGQQADGVAWHSYTAAPEDKIAGVASLRQARAWKRACSAGCQPQICG